MSSFKNAEAGIIVDKLIKTIPGAEGALVN